MIVDEEVDVGDVRRQLDLVNEHADDDRRVDREQETPGVFLKVSEHMALDARHPPLSSRRRPGPIATNVRLEPRLEPLSFPTITAGGYGSRPSPGRRRIDS